MSDKLQVRLLATTDIHGFYMNFDYYKDQQIDRLGLISLANVIEDARSENPNTLLFDNGDLLQGSPMSDYLRDYAIANEHPAYSLMNEMNYDAATLGNHEFNFGVPYLLDVLNQANFPYVNANITNSEGDYLLPPSVMLEREFVTDLGEKVALKIGVTGILPPQIMTWDKNHLDEYAVTNEQLVTHDAVNATQTQVELLKSQGADIVVVLAHTGISRRPFELEMENSGYYIAQIKDVDALITGHQHRRFPSDNFRDMSALGIDVDQGTICGTPTVMAGSWARWLGVIDLELTQDEALKWQVSSGSSALRYIEDFLTENRGVNPEYLEVMESAHEAVRETMSVPVGVSDAGFYSYLSLIQDDNCIQIVADAQTHYAKKLLKERGLLDELPILSAVPLFKVGSRKDDPTYFTEIAPGELFFKDVADLYVYPNYLVVLEINGENLKEWLECCASIYHTIDPEDNAPQHLINWAKYRPYNFDIIKGIEYEINPAVRPRYSPDLELFDARNERIMNLRFKGKKVAATDRFYLATNSYRALVDRFPGAGSGNVVCATRKEIPEVILAYIMAKSEEGILEITPDNNWGLDLSSLQDTRLIIETANTPTAKAIIARDSRYMMHYIGQDAEKFALYEIDVNATLL
ncbi:bifunctional 2',3'-cyclic-nucleotide 2'-phosphodiesterase/3'-nucleotidase [Ignatzschineria rhizosphaerae]|uniref:Bifunctional 2',3'-cyclic-nucleotide 2'-phosphodiesterase/3'-nucleotidase n=1 Tax=Ignatzschineria rhizosphaerae TaxID=2923279 RepID=A0ABY3WXZ8_9GAMM|nr:bifunctional 2',3'-cyclic-nucleotide 2'-phosphodiesterase/3'-nucleotidase [Ignatzschineria rhizosphaerae]UNM95487.1 bifunctional 2',3'-cyclic-nucleotide 2'-phosphodiesterase/3'-nucleotidase [Ignatzschineria rhizosphaerae]